MPSIFVQRNQQNIFFAIFAALSVCTANISLAEAAESKGKQQTQKKVISAKKQSNSSRVMQNASVKKTRANPPQKTQLAKNKHKTALHKRYRQNIEVKKISYVMPVPAIASMMGDEQSNSLPLYSKIIYVVDQRNSKPLIDKNSRLVVPIASITKLMTAMVVLDAGLPLDETLTVTDADRDFIKNTTSRLSIGSSLSRREMLLISLMSSENRAASALARYYPGGEKAFIQAMNAKARSLGMLDTYFENSTGLSSANVSTARDLVKLVNAAYEYPLIREYSTSAQHSVHTGSKMLAYRTSNGLVRNADWDIGLQKTGYIREAGECLVMQTVVNGMPVVMVFLNAQGKYNRFTDASKVRHWLGTPSVRQYALNS